MYDSLGTLCWCRGGNPVNLKPEKLLEQWLRSVGKDDVADEWRRGSHTPLELFHRPDLPPCMPEYAACCPIAPDHVLKKRGEEIRSHARLEGCLNEYLDVLAKIKSGRKGCSAAEGNAYLLGHTGLDFDLNLVEPQNLATPIWSEEEVGKARTGPRQQKVRPADMPPGIIHMGYKYRWEGESRVIPWNFYHCLITSCTKGCDARIKVMRNGDQFEVDEPFLAVEKHIRPTASTSK